MADIENATERASRKTREGVVRTVGMDKTAIVTVTSRKPHPRYGKSIARDKKFFVHDEENTCRVGDIVRFMETRPLSKNKRWRLTEVVQRAR